MAVRIRLTRVGKKHAPFFRIVATDSRRKRDGQALEILGTYNPRTKTFDKFHEDRIQDWVSKGAQFTDSAKKVVKLHSKSAA